MKGRNEKNGEGFGTDQQPQAVEDDQEQEQDEDQRDIGQLELAGRAILLVIQDGIGMKKIDKSDKDEKIDQVDEKKFPDAGIFHRIKS